MRLANEWCLRVKCMCPPLHVCDHLMEEFTHMCHMLSNMYSISCVTTFLAQKIFAMIEGVAFLVNLKQYRAACNCSWIVTSLTSSTHQCLLQFVNKRNVAWKVLDNIHVCSQKFKHRQGRLSRTITMTDTPTYKASFHGTFSPCFFH